VPTAVPSTVAETIADAVGQPGRRRTTKPAGAANAAMLQERARIARDLHDSVSQTLYAITVTASRALRLLELDERNEVHQFIDDVLKLANAGQSELRALLSNIHSDPTTSQGLTVALASLAADMRIRSGLDIRLSCADEPDVPAAAKEALMIICREALHNVVKHASADHVDVVLEIDAAALVLLITDDGRGFDAAASRPGHFGLRSMRERAAIVGGTFDLLSADGVGTRIRVTVPRTSGQ
jgi:signal transduction histidine kinase